MMMYGFGHAGLGWVGLLLGAVFWAVIISLIIWLVMRMSRQGYWMHDARNNQNALGIAKERYAKGEINHEEFETIKKNLS